MATFFDFLFPENMDESEQLDQFRLALETSQDPIIQLLAWVGLSVANLRQSPSSEGYEPALVENGFHPLAARGVAKIAVRAGTRQAKESKRRRPVFDSIRFLSISRQTRAIRSRAKIILAAWNDTSIVETLFSDADQSETELIGILKAVVDGKAVDVNRLAEICAAIAPHLSLDRGPKVSAPSAAHNFILESGIELTKRRLPYARRDRSASNDDALTEATRREFDIPHFDSRPARRRLKRSRNHIK
jgi:hypothetical protein